MRIIYLCSFPALLAAAVSAIAADAPPAANPRPVITCTGCGIVYNIRRLEKPVARERDVLPNIASSPGMGGMGNSVQAVPLFSIGSGGAQRVQPEAVTRTFWEVTVRYDAGSLGFVVLQAEPDLKVGDRVRLIENVLEPLNPPAR